MPMVKSQYGPKGTLTTSMQREAVDLGPTPDFWGDLDRMRRKIKPREREAPRYSAPILPRDTGSSRSQGESLRSSGPTMSFVKRIGGPNIVSGYVQANAGDPGAVYGGWIPEGAAMSAGGGGGNITLSGSGGNAFAGDPFFAADYARAISNSQSAQDDGRFAVPVVKGYDDQGRPIVGPDLLR